MNPTPRGAVYPSYLRHEPSIIACSAVLIRARSALLAPANVKAIHSSRTSAGDRLGSQARRPKAYRLACARGCRVQNSSVPTLETPTIPPGRPDVVAELIWATVRVPVSYTHLRAHETGRNLVC